MGAKEFFNRIDPKRTLVGTLICSVGSCIRVLIPDPPNTADSKGYI
jgi:hypothetical protein